MVFPKKKRKQNRSLGTPTTYSPGFLRGLPRSRAENTDPTAALRTPRDSLPALTNSSLQHPFLKHAVVPELFKKAGLPAPKSRCVPFGPPRLGFPVLEMSHSGSEPEIELSTVSKTGGGMLSSLPPSLTTAHTHLSERPGGPAPLLIKKGALTSPRKTLRINPSLTPREVRWLAQGSRDTEDSQVKGPGPIKT